MNPKIRDDKDSQRFQWYVLLFLSSAKMLLPDFIDKLSRGSSALETVEIVIGSGRNQIASILSLFLDLTGCALSIWLLTSNRSRQQLNKPARTTLVIPSIVACFILVLFSSIFLHDGLQRSTIVLVLLSSALLLAKPADIEPKVVLFRISKIVVSSSVFVGLFLPKLSWQVGGLDQRFSLFEFQRLLGVTSHPNMLGYWCVILLVLCIQNLSKKFSHWIWLSVALAALLATGSRTAALGATLAIVLYFLMKVIRYKTLGLIFMASVLTLAVVPLLNPYGLANLEGRVDIWVVASQAWQQSWLVGYGADFWQGNQLQLGFPNYAFHAHNEITDLALIGGMLLVSAFTVHLFLVIKAFATSSYKQAALSGPLLIIIFTQMILEVPLQFTLFDSRQMLYCLVLLSIVPKKEV